jgi:hypothetical protein
VAQGLLIYLKIKSHTTKLKSKFDTIHCNRIALFRSSDVGGLHATLATAGRVAAFAAATACVTGTGTSATALVATLQALS